MFDLEQHGYALDESTGIWGRLDFKGIAYSDGDTTEVKLGDIIREASDVSVFSTELSKHCTDWATLYHLSSTREIFFALLSPILVGAFWKLVPVAAQSAATWENAAGRC